MLEAAVPVVDAIRAACRELVPTRDHAELLRTISKALKAPARLALIDEGWHCGGALIDGEGQRIADDFESWALEQCGGDLTSLYAHFAGADYHVTGIRGRTFYITAPTGLEPLDFLQVEVDEVREVVERRLFEDDIVPDLVADLMEPSEYARPLSPPRYRLRKVMSFADKAEQLVGEHKGDPRFRRFLDEWMVSSAGRSSRFCDHWVLSIMPYQAADGEHLLEARPIPTAKVVLPDLARLRTGAVEYHPTRSVMALDVQAGYPMAWYFLQVTEHYAPYRCIQDVREDFIEPPPGVARLAPHDMSILDNWVEVPYTFH